jgi:hypothetical protein
MRLTQNWLLSRGLLDRQDRHDGVRKKLVLESVHSPTLD